MAKDNDGLLIVLGLGVAAFVGLRLAKAHSQRGPMTTFSTDPVDSQLTANFRELEFKRSSNPELDYKLQRYILPAEYRNNMITLAVALQKARDVYGPLTISNGGRPAGIYDSQGRDFYAWLKTQGYNPASDSQHRDFSGVDVMVPVPGTRWAVFDFLRQDPVLGEVILYIVNGVPSHIHVGLRKPGIRPEHLISEGGKTRPAPSVDPRNFRLVS